MEPIWIGSSIDVRQGQQALEALNLQNDAKYWVEGLGIIKVDKARWEAAQIYERDGWMQSWADAADDRSAEHYQLFDSYNQVTTNLGVVLEVGCGPFTQLRQIQHGRIVDRVTLQDPLINSYLNHRHCTYHGGNFFNHPTTLLSCMLEEITAVNEFNTLICNNVLEHVMDVELCLRNMHAALITGGLIIFGERCYDGLDPTLLYDVGHPIRICKTIVEQFKYNFEILFERNDNGYFIGRKL